MNDRCIIQITDAGNRSRWLRFAAPSRVLTVTEPADVLPALRELEEAVNAGASVAGYLTYEAAGGLDPALHTWPRGSLPLLRFGLYTDFTVHDKPPLDSAPYAIGEWTPSIGVDDYANAIAAIKDRIARGETYQVNFTLRLRAPITGDPAAWFHALHRAQQPRYAAFLEYGHDAICSVSPEAFFTLDRHDLVCRPMKGTSRRGLTWRDDHERAVRLHHSTKNRAENLMIVDMTRNDLGRIAQTGTVQTERLFEVERYPTVLQMTSTVRARTSAGFTDIMRALFPCASITGAPKVRTMEIIKQLESGPRGIYTGSIGFMTPRHPLSGAPGRFAQFNVAIRTAHIRQNDHRVEYGTGGGIVWDSEAKMEYRECRTKALILTTPPRDFSLLETILWKPGTGLFLLEEHLRRLETSAQYFGIAAEPAEVRAALETATTELPAQRHRVRCLLGPNGDITVETAPIERTQRPWRVVLDDRPVDSGDPFLYHKTTHRDVYEQARARHPDADDVLLCNAHGEITESCVANVLVHMDGTWYTPPVVCGLLDGTLRAALVQRGRVREKILTRTDLREADRIGLINSVRGYIGAHVVI